jgi:hypothetical protein
MDLVPYLSAVILASTIATMVLAVLSYAAFKLRNRRRPRAETSRPSYFRRIRLDEMDAQPEPEQ